MTATNTNTTIRKQPAPIVVWMRKHKIITGIIIAVVAIVAFNAVSHAVLHDSLSYKDGYSYGVKDATSQGAVNGENFAKICQIMAVPAGNGGELPAGDDASQWTAGCTDGESTQANLNTHPGA